MAWLSQARVAPSVNISGRATMSRGWLGGAQVATRSIASRSGTDRLATSSACKGKTEDGGVVRASSRAGAEINTPRSNGALML